MKKITRPRIRGDCGNIPRPCPFVSCRYNLFLEVHPVLGTIRFNYGNLEPWEVPNSLCSLDYADKHPEGLTLTEVGDCLQLTRERIRQLELAGLAKLQNRLLQSDFFNWHRDDPQAAIEYKIHLDDTWDEELAEI